MHDIGIHICEKKYGSTAGTYQEKEGPSEARKLMTSLGFSKDDIERVCYLVAHHHTYTDDMSPDYRILIEADFIVNAFEDSLDKKAVSAARKIFSERKQAKSCWTKFIWRSIVKNNIGFICPVCKNHL